MTRVFSSTRVEGASPKKGRFGASTRREAELVPVDHGDGPRDVEAFFEGGFGLLRVLELALEHGLHVAVGTLVEVPPFGAWG